MSLSVKCTGIDIILAAVFVQSDAIKVLNATHIYVGCQLGLSALVEVTGIDTEPHQLLGSGNMEVAVSSRSHIVFLIEEIHTLAANTVHKVMLVGIGVALQQLCNLRNI